METPYSSKGNMIWKNTYTISLTETNAKSYYIYMQQALSNGGGREMASFFS